MNIKTNANAPASPLTGDAYLDYYMYDGTKNTSYNPECQGLTKREAFAMAAMQGLLSNSHLADILTSANSSVDCQSVLISSSVSCADDLLKALED